MSMPHTVPLPTHDTTTPSCSIPPPEITATTTNVQIYDQPLLQTPTMMMMPKPHSQLLLQRDFHLPPSLSKLQQQQQPVSIKNGLPSIRKHMELDQPFPTTPLPTAPPGNGAPFPPTEPNKRPLPTAPATPMRPIQSRLERLLNNLHDNPIAPWMPDTICWCCVLHLSREQDMSPAHHTECDNSTPAVKDTIPYHNNNPLVTNYATSTYNPAFDLHPTMFRHCQKCPPHHSTQTNYITSPYNPAFNIHPTPAKHQLKCHQPYAQLPLAPPVLVCAQHKRPP